MGWQPINDDTPKDVEILVAQQQKSGAWVQSIIFWRDYCLHNQPKYIRWMPLPAAPAE